MNVWYAQYKSIEKELGVKNTQKIYRIPRSKLIKWIINTGILFKLKLNTIYVAIDCVDRYLLVKRVRKSKLKLVCASCLSLACKYLELEPLMLQNFVIVLNNEGESNTVFSKSDIMNFEIKVLWTLDFKLNNLTKYDLVHVLSSYFNFNTKDQLLANYVCLTSSIYINYYEYSHTAVVCGAICLIQSCKLKLEEPVWTHKLKKLTKYSTSYISKIAKLLCHMCFYSNNNYETISSMVKIPYICGYEFSP